jgi:ABC-type lipoprotein release transport system permease subunit
MSTPNESFITWFTVIGIVLVVMGLILGLVPV